ncbi:MAG: hypothetical protein MO852_07220 [Candidatus Devosia euplotis]|nr:hypothetical protein [Candidatus Devosia euplotis]
MLAKIAAEFAKTSTEDTKVLYRRKDGSGFWTAVLITPVRDADGEIVQYFTSFVDPARHMLAQTHLRMLVDELNHRIKNTLATVQSIVWQALRFDPDPIAARKAIEDRLFALSRSHDLLTTQHWKSASLFDLTRQATAPFELADQQNERSTIGGPDIRMPPRPHSLSVLRSMNWRPMPPNLAHSPARRAVSRCIGKSRFRTAGVAWISSGARVAGPL